MLRLQWCRYVTQVAPHGDALQSKPSVDLRWNHGTRVLFALTMLKADGFSHAREVLNRSLRHLAPLSKAHSDSALARDDRKLKDSVMSECGIELDTGIVPDYRGASFEDAIRDFLNDLEIDGFTQVGSGSVDKAIRNGESLWVGDRVALGGYVTLVGTDETE